MVLFSQEMESDPICRRNNFAELHACVFQRLTKYPLLLGSLIKQTHHQSNKGEELARLRDAEKSARDLLTEVNRDIRMWENKHFLDLVLKKCAMVFEFSVMCFWLMYTYNVLMYVYNLLSPA